MIKLCQMISVLVPVAQPLNESSGIAVTMLNEAPHHQDVLGSESIAPHILKISTK
jgi:hypothetical protein